MRAGSEGQSKSGWIRGGWQQSHGAEARISVSTAAIKLVFIMCLEKGKRYMHGFRARPSQYDHHNII